MMLALCCRLLILNAYHLCLLRFICNVKIAPCDVKSCNMYMWENRKIIDVPIFFPVVKFITLSISYQCRRQHAFLRRFARQQRLGWLRRWVDMDYGYGRIFQSNERRRWWWLPLDRGHVTHRILNDDAFTPIMYNNNKKKKYQLQRVKKKSVHLTREAVPYLPCTRRRILLLLGPWYLTLWWWGGDFSIAEIAKKSTMVNVQRVEGICMDCDMMLLPLLLLMLLAEVALAKVFAWKSREGVERVRKNCIAKHNPTARVNIEQVLQLLEAPRGHMPPRWLCLSVFWVLSEALVPHTSNAVLAARPPQFDLMPRCKRAHAPHSSSL